MNTPQSLNNLQKFVAKVEGVAKWKNPYKKQGEVVFATTILSGLLAFLYFTWGVSEIDLLLKVFLTVLSPIVCAVPACVSYLGMSVFMKCKYKDNRWNTALNYISSECSEEAKYHRKNFIEMLQKHNIDFDRDEIKQLQELDKNIHLTASFWGKCIRIVQSSIANEKLDNPWLYRVEVEESPATRAADVNNPCVLKNMKL